MENSAPARTYFVTSMCSTWIRAINSYPSMCLLFFSLCIRFTYTHMCMAYVSACRFSYLSFMFRAMVWRRRRRVRTILYRYYFSLCFKWICVSGWKISGVMSVIYPEFAAWLVKNQGKLLASLRQSNENSLRKMHNFQEKTFRSSFTFVCDCSIENPMKCTRVHTRP